MGLRREETVLLVKDLFKATRSGYTKVVMNDRLLELSFNVVMRMACGRRLFGSDVENMEEATRFRGIISEIFEMAGASNPNDYVKFLQWIDFQGFEKKMISLQERSDTFLQSLVDQLRSQRKANGVDITQNSVSTAGGQNPQTLIDEMLGLQEEQPESFTDELIKGNISNVLLAGTDTSSSTTEWAMSLLLNNPEELKKVRDEIDMNIGHDQLVDETDLSRLPYLQCVVHETLRIFPVSPLLAPHVSSEDCVIGGYDIPRGTMVLANAWALHRDPKVWEDPLTFRPERFKGAQTETYKFVPFGMGRRKCPGATLANRVVCRSLAALIQCFDWERVGEELIDLSEGHGLTMPKKIPLEVMCKPREQMMHFFNNL
jgi:cytochrome P450